MIRILSTKWADQDGGGLRQRLISGLKWNVVEAASVALSNLAAAVITARLLGLDDFGGYSIIRSTVYMMASVAGLSLGVTATKYVAELRTTDPLRLGDILGLCSAIAGATGVCFAVGLFVFAPAIATHNLNAPQLSEQLRIAAVYILFVTMNGYQVGALVGFEAFAKLAKINLLQALASLAITFFLTWLGGLTGAALALGLAAACSWVFHHLAIRAELAKYALTIRYRGLWRERAVFTGFAFPAAIAGIIGSVAVWAGNAYLVNKPDGLAQMAIFTAASTFRSLILFGPGLVTRVAAPILCNLLGESKAASYQRVFWFNLAVSAGVATVVAGFLAAAAPYLLALFGQGFAGNRDVLLVVAAMSVVEIIANTLYQPLYAHGRLWWQVGIIICWSAALLAVTMATVGRYGALGLAYAYLAAHLVSAAMYALAMYRLEKAAPPPRPQEKENV